MIDEVLLTKDEIAAIHNKVWDTTKGEDFGKKLDKAIEAENKAH